MSDALTTCTLGWYLCIEFKIVCNDHDHDEDNDEDYDENDNEEDGQDGE